MTLTLDSDSDVLTHVDLKVDACLRDGRAGRVGDDRHQVDRTRPSRERCAEKHAFARFEFPSDSRPGFSPVNAQVTPGETGVSGQVNVGVVSYYGPATAQFLTPDPLFAVTGSRYGYAGNDPVNGSDPTGEICLSWTCVKGDVRAAAHTVNNDVVEPVRTTCGTIGNSNCASYASSTTWGHDTLIGASAVLAVDTLALGGAALATGSFAVGAAGVGLGAVGTGVDANGCFSQHINAACRGFTLNAIATGAGLAALFGPEWLGSAALVTGGFAAEYDFATASFDCGDN